MDSLLLYRHLYKLCVGLGIDLKISDDLAIAYEFIEAFFLNVMEDDEDVDQYNDDEIEDEIGEFSSQIEDVLNYSSHIFGHYKPFMNPEMRGFFVP